MEAVQGIALAGIGLGVIFAGTPLLELVSLLQTSYLSVSTVDDVNPVQASVYMLKYMNGYNKFFNETNITFFDTTSSVSRRLLQ
jgi:hypothetical protein